MAFAADSARRFADAIIFWPVARPAVFSFIYSLSIAGPAAPAIFHQVIIGSGAHGLDGGGFADSAGDDDEGMSNSLPSRVRALPAH